MLSLPIMSWGLYCLGLYISQRPDPQCEWASVRKYSKWCLPQCMSRPCLIKNPGAQKNALLDSHIYPEGSNFIRPPVILSGARNKTVVAVGFSEDRTNTCTVETRIRTTSQQRPTCYATTFGPVLNCFFYIHVCQTLAMETTPYCAHPAL